MCVYINKTGLMEGKGGYMKKIVVTLIAATLLSATTAAPVFAHGYYGRGGVVIDPLWPVAAALAIPAAILGTVANAITPAPVYVAPPAPVYSGPATYYAPRPYYRPRVYYAPRAYYPSRYYYAPRYYRTYGW
jgi:hypothetical protein